MSEFLESLPALQKVYFISAIVGGTGFVVMTAIQFLGADLELDGDASGDVGMDTSGTADVSFKLLSVHGLTAFSMIFGLAGLSLTREFGTTWFESLVGATLAGSATVWILKKLFAFFVGLKSSGTTNMNRAINEQGTVYMQIPSDGVGKVQLPVQGRLQTLDAVSADHQELSTGTRVQVVEIISGDTLKVKKAD
ncbi:MAG: hypothetical protein VX834_03010 [Myxococcota bacterium]|nr:hypothetical protein [Myxococcota bacterium]